MKLWVGLGNPGGQYAGNRHNIGFMAVEAIASQHGFGPWRGKFQGEIAEGRIGAEKVLLLKPATFMNLSGDSVQAAMTFFKIPVGDVTVFHDELDLEPGRLRLKLGGGHAGHNGLRSIDAHVGAAFQRVRLGIGHPGDRRLVSNYVLGDFAKADAAWLAPLLEGISAAAPLLVAGEGSKFLSAVALKLAPPKPLTEKKPVAAPPKPPEPAPETGAETGAGGESDPLRRLVERFRR